MKRALALILVLLLAVSVFAACKKKDGETETVATQELVDGAADMLYEFNKPGDKNVKAADFTLPTATEYEGLNITVTWTVEGGNDLVSVENGETTATVKVNKYAAEDTEFTLKGLVKCGEFEKEISFKYVIKEYVISDWAYWSENTKDVNMNIKGIVVAKYPYNATNKNTGVFLQDLDGEHGYFAYRLKCESEAAYNTDLAIGNILEINGTTSIYNGFREMGAGCTYDVVKNEDGTNKTAVITKIALDEKIAAGANLDQYQGMIGTITGFKVKSIEWNTALNEETKVGSVYITVTKDAKDFKLYLSTSNQLGFEDLKAEVAKVSIGYTVSVEGPLASYNGVQMYPCVGGITVTSTEVTAADKIDAESLAVKFPVLVDEATSITLAATGATYTDVAFAWALNHGAAAAAIEEGKLNFTIPADSVESVTLTLTMTCGEEEKTFTYNILVGELTPANIVNAAYTLSGTSTLPNMTLTGEIVKVDTAYSADFKNITVTIVAAGLFDKPIQCFRAVAANADVDITELAVGNTITVTGTIKNYKGTIEFDAGNKISAVEKTAVSDGGKAYATANGFTFDEIVTEEKEIVLAATGATYTDVTLEWNLNEGATVAEIADGKLTITPVEGTEEVITVTLTATCGEKEYEKSFVITVTKELTINTWAEWKAAAADTALNIKGVIVEKFPYNATNKFVTLYLQDIDGEHGYMAFKMACESEEAYNTDLALGNVIIVSGKKAEYKGLREMGQGCTYTLVKNEDAPIIKAALDDVIGTADAATKLDALQGMICTLTGVTVKSATLNGAATQLTIVVTVNETDFTLFCSTGNQYTKEQIAAITVQAGDTINVEGVLSWFNNAQLLPIVGGITVVTE